MLLGRLSYTKSGANKRLWFDVPENALIEYMSVQKSYT